MSAARICAKRVMGECTTEDHTPFCQQAAVSCRVSLVLCFFFCRCRVVSLDEACGNARQGLLVNCRLTECGEQTDLYFHFTVAPCAFILSRCSVFVEVHHYNNVCCQPSGFLLTPPPKKNKPPGLVFGSGGGNPEVGGAYFWVHFFRVP